MDISQKILSEITIFNKYARFIPELSRRETWDELCERNMAMHIRKYPMLKEEIKKVYADFVIQKKVLPSMRSLQFGGTSIELSNNRMYNCFSSDTKFITSTGTKSFSDFNDGDVITVKTHLGNWKSAVVKNYGSQDLNEVEFRRGKTTKTIRVTDNHRWILNGGTETTQLEAGNIIEFAPLADNFDFDSANPLEKLYWCYGYVFGDGTKVKDKNGEYKHSMVRLCGADKEKFSYRFEEMGFQSSSSHTCGGDPIFYTGSYLKTPVDLETEDMNMSHAFLDGYLCADAEKNPNWYKDEKNSKYVGIQSSNEDHISLLRNGLETFGYYIINEDDLSHEVTNFGQRKSGTKKFRILNGIGETNNSKWKVSSITKNVATEQVWCLEVEDDHSFILSGGIVTGNCAYQPIDHTDAFSETMFLLLGGTGVGYSVQLHHVDKLPVITGPKDKTRRFLIGDSIEGWSDAIKILVEASFYNKAEPVFDYRGIRPKGARLVTSGGKAPGPAPLRICIEQIRGILSNAKGRKITPIEAHDIQCHIADAVLSGGIRRAAMISLFSKDDMDMLSCKTGAWWELNPARGRANNSVVLERNNITDEDFFDIWDRVQESGAGEPGIFWTNDKEIGTNPCAEIALNAHQFCNVTETNVSDVTTQEELNARVKAAAFLGTIQAGYTDFHYLRPEWEEVTKREALIGVGMTGIGSGGVLGCDLKEAALIVVEENARVAGIININKAARCTTIKPSGCVTLDTKIKTSMGYGISMREIFNCQGYDEEYLSALSGGTWLEIKPEMKELPFVLDENNVPREITKLYVNGQQEVFEIEFEDGNSYKFTGNHRLMTKDGWKRVDELKETDEIQNEDYDKCLQTAKEFLEK